MERLHRWVTTLLICLNMIANYQFDEASSDDNDGNNISAVQQIFVPTLLETGQLKFLASWFLSEEEIQAIVDSNSMKELNEEIDNTLINIGGSGNLDFSGGSVGLNTDPIEIHEVSGSTFYGTMMIVKDPSRVSLATIYPWRTEGVTLDELVKSVGAVGGINGGLYNSNNNSGGRPYGVVVSNGEIQLNEPQSWKGLVLIGLTEENILQIIDISKMNSDEI